MERNVFASACAVRFRRGRRDPCFIPWRTFAARDRAGEMTVENPGAEDTPVDMEKLKASLSCPLCNDMYRFPVTVVSAHSTISGTPPPIRPPRPRSRPDLPPPA